ncbi:hypothetical protein NOR_07531 [Metarhizium rileyi]|uniref:Uncharacterized protein n=1 Tax=Metarhizium rileyi (strain RCEF 4871) TaxID=1649241 RepID=A0A166Y2E9_METRR|nr:hypothetical protein NOR_07531 [Metarhizium rileyi RCEF 4871]
MLETLIVCLCGLLITMLAGYLLGLLLPLLSAADARAASSKGTTVSAQKGLSTHSGTLESAFVSLPKGVSEHKTCTDSDGMDWAEWCHHVAQRSSHTEELQHVCEPRTLPAGDQDKRQSYRSLNPLIIRRAVAGGIAMVAALYECQTLADNFAHRCLAQPGDNNNNNNGSKFLRGYDCLEYGGALFIVFATASAIQFTGGMYAETIAAWTHAILGKLVGAARRAEPC